MILITHFFLARRFELCLFGIGIPPPSAPHFLPIAVVFCETAQRDYFPDVEVFYSTNFLYPLDA